MHMIREDDIETYTSYDEAWAVPILFPISIGLLVQASVYIDACRRRPRAAEVYAIVGLETAFGVACLTQCSTNFAMRDYVGGKMACAVQGWYTTLYVFGSLNLYVLNFARLHTPVDLPCSWAFVIIGAAAVASLPLAGIGSYAFATDFCIPDPQTFTIALITDYVLAIVGMTILLYKRRDRIFARGLTIDYAAAVYLPLVATAIIELAQGNVPHRLFTLVAIAMHFNQIAVPLIWGWYW